MACIVYRSPQHIHQALILAAEVQCAIRSGIPGSDFGSLGVLPIEGSTGSPCAAIVSISGCFTIETNGNGIIRLPHTAATVCAFANARPRLFTALCGDADAAYPQGVFAIGQSVALLGQFVLRAGSKQQAKDTEVK